MEINTPIVCLAFPAWEGDYLKSTVQLVSRLAKDHPVLYVDYAYTWKDFFAAVLSGKGHAPWKRMLGLQPRLRRVQTAVGSSLWLLTLPPVLPINFIKNNALHDFLMSINAARIKKAVQAAMRQLKWENPVVLNAFLPGYGSKLAGRLGERRLVYYCYDEIKAAAWAGRHGARWEKQLCSKVDAMVVSSEGLAASKSGLHPGIRVVKNGVDAAAFAKQAAPPLIPGREQFDKVIGYIGSVDDRLDGDLLAAAATRFPEHLLVFAGRVTDNKLAARLQQFPNVYLAGPQPVASLPAWVQQFDAGLIPFVANELTAGIYPLKINEYLAAGVPVVSTNFAPLKEFEPFICLATQQEAFLEGIHRALIAPDDTAIASGRKMAASNDWNARAAALSVCLIPKNGQ